MIRKNESYYLFRVFNTLFLLFIVAITLLPFVNIVAKSFSDMKHISMNDVSLWPKGFTTDTYKVIMGDSTFWANYKNTIIYTLLGTVISLFLTVLIAYPLSVGRLKGKNIILTFVVLTMFFNGGMIPNYVLVRSLGMRNTIWAIVVPGAVSTFYVLVMKTFFEGIPRELEEAAIVDGMDTYGILGKIILPLSKPIIATMVLFYAVGAWNNWFSAFLYLDHAEMYPVTIYLRNIIAGAMSQSGAGDSDTMSSISSNIKAVTIVLTSVPILSIYPFLQRYFVQGMMIGSVKG